MQKKSLETFLYSVGGIVAMALILVAINVITSGMRQRVDLTSEKAYTLSEGTRAVLAKLDTPVKIRFYSSQSAPSTPQSVFLKIYARKVEDLLAEYKQAAKGKIILEKYDPQPDSDAEDSARLDGITGAQMPSGDMFYLGIAVNLLDSKEAIPFCQPTRERLLEYDLTRAITRVVTPAKPVVGIMSALPVFGGGGNPMMMMQMGQRPQPAWAVVSELQKDFTVRRIEMDGQKIADDVKVLFLIHPREISEATQYAVDQFILRGGKVVAFLDSNSLTESRNQNPMMGQMGGKSSTLDKLLPAWGVNFETDKVVADPGFQMIMGNGMEAQRPTWLSLTPEGLDKDDIVTSQIDNVWYFNGGAFSGTPAEGLKQTVLLKSTSQAGLVEGMLASMAPQAAMKDFKAGGKELALAIRLTGKFKTAFPNGNPIAASTDTNAPATKEESLKEAKAESTVILVGDADMIQDNFTIEDSQTPFGNWRRQFNANLNFAQNAVEQLAGDNNLITMRSRATLNRPFEVVRKKEAEATEKFQGVLEELQKKAEEANRRISELQAQKSDTNQRFIITPEQQAELLKLEKESVETDKKLRSLKKDLAREVDSLKTTITWWNIFAMPALVTAGGITLAVYKRKLTAAK